MDRDSDGSTGCSDSVVPTSRLLHSTAMHGIASLFLGSRQKEPTWTHNLLATLRRAEMYVELNTYFTTCNWY